MKRKLLERTIITGLCIVLIGFVNIFDIRAVSGQVYKTVPTQTPALGFLSNYPVLSLPDPTANPVVYLPSPTPKPRYLGVSKTVQKVPSDAPKSCPGMLWPVEGSKSLSRGFIGGHKGLDIQSNGRSIPILAALGGKVIQAETNSRIGDKSAHGGYGNVIVIDHGNGYQTRYGHNSKVLVKVGDEVKAGDQIAVMGKTGKVFGQTGIHLHFEVIKNGQRINPKGCL